ncbi:hypothetical protein CLOM_g9459 [Closterium sp. NIES-68]|nr:hypothetical protein CLOM_g9459 [Closterium sp. NIES-68]
MPLGSFQRLNWLSQRSEKTGRVAIFASSSNSPSTEPATESRARAEMAAADAGRRLIGRVSAVPLVCVEGNFHSRNRLLRRRLLDQQVR